MKELNVIAALAGQFEKLPGVGKKTAVRYAFSIVDKFSKDDVTEMAQALFDCKNRIRHCPVCGMLTEDDICEICSDSGRDHSKIIVIKDTRDVYSIEKTNQYHGLYHILNGLISPLDGVGPDDINIAALEKRLKDGMIRELIIATSFTPSGETTALYLKRILGHEGLEISRIGYGLPAGGDIEYVDELTLAKALEAKQKI